MSIDEARLAVLGQIVVTENRLNVLRELLEVQPMGGIEPRWNIDDAIGNLSLQTGVMIGVVSNYKDAVAHAIDPVTPNVQEGP